MKRLAGWMLLVAFALPVHAGLKEAEAAVEMRNEALGPSVRNAEELMKGL